MSSPPWRRAPWLLLRRPGVLATVAGACAVLSAAVAGVPMFLSSVGTEAIAQQVGDRCAAATGASRFFHASAFRVASPGSDPFAPLDDSLEQSSRWVRVDDLRLGHASDPVRSTGVFLLTGDDVLDHIDVVEGGGPGVWITDRAATATGLAPGDIATIGTAEAPVAGIYRDLAGPTVDDYWCSHADMLLLEGPERIPPPPVVLADNETFAALHSELVNPGTTPGDPRRSTAWGAWEAPLRAGVTIAAAEELVDELACEGEKTAALDWCGADGARNTPPFATGDDEKFVSSFFETSLPFVAARAHAIETSVGGGVWPVAAFAALAGAGLVAVAASFWFERRQRDLALLTVRGVSPAGLGVKAMLELLLPIAIGAAAGVVLAYGSVVWLGPSTQIESASVAQAALAGAAAALAAAVIVGGVVAWRVRTHTARRHRFHFGLVPWELGLIALTVWSARRLGEWGVPVGRGADVSRVDVIGLLFPILFLVTVVAVCGRLLSLALRPVQVASRGWPTALYLAIRRVARYRVAAIGLVAACALAAGVVTYAATLERSLDATLDAKAEVFVGSDVAARLGADAEVPPELEAQSTVVDVHRYGWLDKADGREEVVVYGIDPSTFARAAYWDDSFSDHSLDEILERLAAPPEDGRIPAVLVGYDAPAVVEGGIAATGSTRFTIEQVIDADAMPGLARAAPTIYVDAAALASLDDLPEPTATEAWIRGDRGDTLAALEAANTSFVEERRAGDVADRASFLTVSWTFGFMQSLGIAAGALVIGGLAVYVEARRRGRVLGYAFARRMGLTRRQHRRALFVELAASVVVGSVLGFVAALVAARIAYQDIDPVPGFSPDPLLRPAMSMATIVFLVSVTLTAAAAVLAQRRTDRDDPAEVLRAGA